MTRSITRIAFLSIFVIAVLASSASAYRHPTLGRFMGPDPLDYPDGNSRYEMLRSNPMNGTDPTGEDWISQEGDSAYWWPETRGLDVNLPTFKKVFIGKVDTDGLLHIDPSISSSGVRYIHQTNPELLAENGRSFTISLDQAKKIAAGADFLGDFSIKAQQYEIGRALLLGLDKYNTRDMEVRVWYQEGMMTRVSGACQVVGAVGEGVGGLALAWAGCGCKFISGGLSTPVSLVAVGGGVAITGNSCDNGSAGMTKLITGRNQETIFYQGIMEITGSPTLSRYLDNGFFSVGIIGGGFALSRVASGTPGMYTPSQATRTNVQLGKPFDSTKTGLQVGVDPRTLRSGQRQALSRSRIDNPQLNMDAPVEVTQDGRIIDGHHRVMRAIEQNRAIDVIVRPGAMYTTIPPKPVSALPIIK